MDKDVYRLSSPVPLSTVLREPRVGYGQARLSSTGSASPRSCHTPQQTMLRKTYKSPVPLPSPLSPHARLPPPRPVVSSPSVCVTSVPSPPIRSPPRPPTPPPVVCDVPVTYVDPLRSPPPLTVSPPTPPALSITPPAPASPTPPAPLAPKRAPTYSLERERTAPPTPPSIPPPAPPAPTRLSIPPPAPPAPTRLSIPPPASSTPAPQRAPSYSLERERRLEQRRAERLREREVEQENHKARLQEKERLLAKEIQRQEARLLLDVGAAEERGRRKLGREEANGFRVLTDGHCRGRREVTRLLLRRADWEKVQHERFRVQVGDVEKQEGRGRSLKEKMEVSDWGTLMMKSERDVGVVREWEGARGALAEAIDRALVREAQYRAGIEYSSACGSARLGLLASHSKGAAVLSADERTAYISLLSEERCTRALAELTTLEAEEREDFGVIYEEEVCEHLQEFADGKLAIEAAVPSEHSEEEEEEEEERVEDVEQEEAEDSEDNLGHSILTPSDVYSQDDPKQSSTSTLSELSETRLEDSKRTSPTPSSETHITSTRSSKSISGEGDEMTILERRQSMRQMQANAPEPGQPPADTDSIGLTIAVPEAPGPASPRAASSPSAGSTLPISPPILPKKERPPLPPSRASLPTSFEERLLSPILSPANPNPSRASHRRYSLSSGHSSESCKLSPLAETIAAVRSALKAGNSQGAAEALGQAQEQLASDTLAMRLINEMKTGIVSSPSMCSGMERDDVKAFTPERLTAMTLAMLEEHLQLQESLWSEHAINTDEEEEEEEYEEEEEDEEEETDEEPSSDGDEFLAPESIYFKGKPDTKALHATNAYTAVSHGVSGEYKVKFTPPRGLQSRGDSIRRLAEATSVEESQITTTVSSQGDLECTIAGATVGNLAAMKRKLRSTFGESLEIASKSRDDTKLLMAKLLSWYSNKAGDVVMELVQNLRYPPHIRTRMQKRKVLSRIAKTILDKGEYINASAVEVLVLRQYTQKPMDIDRDLGWGDVPLPPDSDSDVAGKLEVQQYEDRYGDWDWSQHLENPDKRNGSLFGPVCAALRDQGPGGSCGAWSEAVLRKWIKWLMTVSAITSPDTSDFLSTTLYRGLGAGGLPGEVVNIHRKMGEDSLLTWPALSSCSLDRDQSVAYMHGHGNNTSNKPTAEKPGTILFELTGVSAGARLSPLSQYPEEEEVLLAPLMTFTVEEVEEDLGNQFGCGLLIKMRCLGLLGCAEQEEQEDLKKFLNGVREDGWCSSMGLLRTVTARASDLWKVVRDRRRSTFSGHLGVDISVPEDLPIPRLKSVKSMREKRSNSTTPGLPGWVRARVAAIDGNELDFFSTVESQPGTPKEGADEDD